MKTVSPLFFLVLFSTNIEAQSNPTIRQIYDFAVGDTFEYFTGNSGGAGQYDLDIILARKNYGSDSIVYTERIFTNTTYNTASSKTLTDKIPFLDSAYYKLWLGPNVYLDSTTTIKSERDTIYQAGMHSIITDYSCLESNYSANLNSTGQCKIGVGATITSYCITGSPCDICGNTTLIYCHKANGQTGGTPYDFVTGVNDLLKDIEISVFPNPATDNFQLQFSMPPPASTFLQIYDAKANLVRQEVIHSALSSFNRGNLDSGLYFWQVIVEDEILQKGRLTLQ